MAIPRLKALRVRDFRSISGEWLVPLDAQVVLIHGQNGAGKTSLLSALELAATGEISYLERLGDRSYRNHLNHRGTHSGEIELTATGPLQRASGSAVVTGSGIDTNPLLSEDLAETFVERCFLPQATLSRLFEVYAPRQNTADTPLIRFVKEVLGLDALDALIDGLYPAGDLRRAQKLSMPWRDASTRLGELNNRRVETMRADADMRGRLDALTAELVVYLDVDTAAENQQAQILSKFEMIEAVRLFNDSKTSTIRAVILQLEALESTLSQEDLLAVDPNETETSSDLSIAEERYSQWKTSRSGPLVEWFDENVSAGDRIGDPRPSEMLRALRLALRGLEAGLAESKSKLAALSDLEQKLIQTRARIDELDSALGQLAESRASVSSSSAASSLASALVAILDHVHGETCPVCDQDFNRLGSLQAHVSAKVEGLNSDAARLVEMETRRASLEAERNAFYRQITDDEAVRSRLGDALILHSQVRREAKDFSDLKALEPLGEAGLLLWDTLDKHRDANSESVRRRNLLERCLEDLDHLAEILGVPAPRGLLAQQVASLRAHAKRQVDELEAATHRASQAAHRRDELVEITNKLDRSSKVVAELDSQLTQISSKIREATARKQAASELRKRAEELRTTVTSRVFDEQLNGSWSRIFGTLVPSEPFVPQFKKVPSGIRGFRIDIETLHRDGLEAAAPAAMLSQGNLNTAALSLFIALHFAVRPRLPWLVFDDPVQSMDDLHISNFASLVKQLTRRNSRQVLIAVHDRELFDYLSLELSPASPNEELLEIVLDRTYGQSVITHKRLTYKEDTSLSPSPAA